MTRTAVYVGILVVLSVSLACGPQSHGGKLPVSNEVTVSYFLLGMLDEYLGRKFLEGGSDVVEHFYPGEVREATIFKDRLLEYARMVEGAHTANVEVGKQGHLYIKSRALCDMLNSYYDYEFGTSGSWEVSSGKRATASSLSLNVFENVNRSAMLAFLAGAYCRYGNGRSFEYANSGKRVELVMELLRRVGCNEVVHTKPNGTGSPLEQRVPCPNKIEFQSTAELDTWLEAVDAIVGGLKR